MTTCGTKRKNEIERVVNSLAKKYARSVYRHEAEDLRQTIWYLVMMAKDRFNPDRKVPFEAWAYYYADMKLKDHFGRGVNLPKTKGLFTLLHSRAVLTEFGDRM